MVKINDNFSLLSPSYLFSAIAARVKAYESAHPGVKVIRMGIGDVTQPLVPAAVAELVKASAEQGRAVTFRGYGPEQGHGFLIDRIVEADYPGLPVGADEVFVGDGAKSDIGNIGDILSVDNVVALTDPVYPVYHDTNVMAGRRIVTLPCTEALDFKPALPSEDAAPDVIYLCYPNNPTGVALTRAELAIWVEYALRHRSLILFDSAYEAYISSPDVPRSIYEIPGARRCAIEFRSFSKTAGFTGLRCGYTVVPRELTARAADGSEVSLNSLWRRRQTTKFNGASYVVQRAAAAVLTPEGKAETRSVIEYYKTNAHMLRDSFEQMGLRAWGADNSPYVWIKAPEGMTSWQFFELLLSEYHIVGTPGIGFGSEGEGYLRLTGFSSLENTSGAINRLKNKLNKS